MAYKPMPFGSGLFLFLMGSRLVQDAPETGLGAFPGERVRSERVLGY